MPPAEHWNFLVRALQLIETASNSDTFRETPAFFRDSSAGSEKMWQLSTQGSPVAIYDSMAWPYRKWGYVLWDLDRLRGDVDGPWRPATELEQRLTSHNMLSKRASWSARASIYRQGGRGWFHPSDTTRIIWPPGRGNREVCW
ncbi:hypothetical protein GLAREA_00901 [Glarea lozoyensis ATCC 20868]|uniref:Uncharacterized protein n=1 Tax=Glarea lozoyensis (strain ATCC 20868 / MF5171) TaxID=1116229 RepID=S3DCL6_GLAL2|nr:uncharacterized protein GLAREA_00901 [Glarea lozoyensis ATCC 20868]EPE29741.1 hypothetical protein GLAREA_00901 [Glarea lozoyensis ATCC 20868]